MNTHRAWTEQELLLAFRLYCRMPFGRLHRHNPDIVELASKIGRTPSAVAMKACNFASLDPEQQGRGIRALGNVSNSDRELWNRFEMNPEEVAAEAETAHQNVIAVQFSNAEMEVELPNGPTETERLVRTRLVQSFFREAVLVSYNFRCAVSGLTFPELLIASHIIPWNVNVERRADPRNGIALNSLYDHAFDRGLITFDESFRMVLSTRLRSGKSSEFHHFAFIEKEGSPLQLPTRFLPDPDFLEYHRNHVFQ